MHPQRAPTRREASDSGVSVEKAAHMPWLPTHELVCGDHPCRPGEGNLKGYRHWGQPYLHREGYVQTRSRRAPHPPNPSTHYAALVRVAQDVARERLVLMAAADWDYREIVLNWIRHAHRLGYRNALVLSMDDELHAELERRKVPTAKNAAK